MKISLICLLAVGLITHIHAQDGSTFDSIVGSSQFQETVNKLKKQAEGAVRSAKQDPETSVRDMSAAFAEKLRNKDVVNRSQQVLNDLTQKSNLLQAQPVIERVQAAINPVDPVEDPLVSGSGIKAGNLPPATRSAARNLKVTPAPKRRSRLPAARSVPRSSAPQVVISPPLERLPALALVTTHAPQRPSRSMQPTSPRIPSSAELFPTVPEPKSVYQRYSSGDKYVPSTDRDQGRPEANSDQMVIESANSTYDKNGKTMTFWGNVVISVQGMEMSCDQLVVNLGEAQKMERITATGGTVQVKRVVTGDDGRDKLQVAKARKAVYIAATQIATLSGGPPSLQNGAQQLNTSSEDSQIVLNQKTGKFQVNSPKSSNGRSVISIPIGGGKGLNNSLDFQKKFNGGR